MSTRIENPLNMMACLAASKLRPDVIAYSIVPRMRTRVVFDQQLKTDDFEINDCIVCGKAQGIGRFNYNDVKDDNANKNNMNEETRAKSCFLAFKLVVASSLKYTDAPPQLALTSQVVCEQCVINAEQNNKSNSQVPTTNNCAPESQCTMVSLMEFQALINTRLPEDLVQTLLVDIARLPKEQWRSFINQWFVKHIFSIDLYQLLWRIRIEAGQEELQQCCQCVYSSTNRKDENETTIKEKRPLVGQCRCHARFWCSVECQRNDWLNSEPPHKQWCFPQVWLPLQFAQHKD